MRLRTFNRLNVEFENVLTNLPTAIQVCEPDMGGLEALFEGVA